MTVTRKDFWKWSVFDKVMRKVWRYTFLTHGILCINDTCACIVKFSKLTQKQLISNHIWCITHKSLLSVVAVKKWPVKVVKKKAESNIAQHAHISATICIFHLKQFCITATTVSTYSLRIIYIIRIT